MAEYRQAGTTTLICLCLCMSLFAMGGATATTASLVGESQAVSPISINITVNGQSDTGGTRLINSTDPHFYANISAHETLRSVVFRVDGETRIRNLTVNKSQYTLDRQVSVTPGKHTLTLIVSTANRTVTKRIQYLKDKQGPIMMFSSPERVSLYGTNTVEVNRTEYIVNFSVRDFVAVSDVTLTLEYYRNRSLSASSSNESANGDSNRTLAGQPIEVKRYQLNASRSQFSTRITLGPGTQRIRVRTEDKFGNQRQKSFVITVTDDQAGPQFTSPLPFTVSNGTSVFETNEPTVRWSSVIHDAIGVNNVTYQLREPDDAVKSGTFIAQPTVSRAQNRQRVNVSKTITLERGRTWLNITATDLFGNAVTHRYQFVYQPVTKAERIRPIVTLYQNRSSLGTNRSQLYLTTTDGTVKSVIIEGKGLTTKRTAFYRVAHTGSNTSQVVFDQAVPTPEQETALLVTVTDALGRTYKLTYRLDSAAGTIRLVRDKAGIGRLVGKATITQSPTVTATATANPTTRTPTATATSMPTVTPTASLTPSASPTATPSPSTTTTRTTSTATTSTGRSPQTPPSPMTEPFVSTGESPITGESKGPGVNTTDDQSTGLLAPPAGVVGGELLLLSVIAVLIWLAVFGSRDDST